MAAYDLEQYFSSIITVIEIIAHASLSIVVISVVGLSDICCIL